MQGRARVCCAASGIGNVEERVGGNGGGRGRNGGGVGAQSGELAGQAVDDGFLFFLELEVHFGGGHGAWVPHWYVTCICAG